MCVCMCKQSTGKQRKSIFISLFLLFSSLLVVFLGENAAAQTNENRCTHYEWHEITGTDKKVPFWAKERTTKKQPTDRPLYFNRDVIFHRCRLRRRCHRCGPPASLRNKFISMDSASSFFICNFICWCTHWHIGKSAPNKHNTTYKHYCSLFLCYC